jgi:hypothetical protein
MLDRVWMLCHPTIGLWYSPPASNAPDAWSNARQWEQYLSGGQPTIGWYEEMRMKGWRAKQVEIKR